MPLPFEFVVVSTGAASGKRWRDLAVACEDFGYSALYVTDHVGQRLAPVPALAAAAQVTSGLRLGTYVLCAGLRNPVLLLRELAALDVLSDGRLDVGLGAGWLAADYAQAGVPMEAGAARLARLAALVSMIKDRWAVPLDSPDGGDRGSGQDQPDAGVRQRPHPPLLIGGGSAGTLSLAAREADVVSLAPRARAGGLDESDACAAAMDRKVALVRAEAGDRIGSLKINLLVWECFVLPRPGEILDVFARSLGCAPEEVRSVPSLLIGSVPEVIDILEERRSRWGACVVTVPESALKPFAPVAAALAGRGQS